MAAAGGSEAILAGGGRAPRHLWDYWRIVWEGRWKLALVLGLTSAAAVAGTFLMAKRYRAEALLEVNLSSALVLGSEFERFQGRSWYERDQAFNTEFEKIRSRRLVRRAIDGNGLLAQVPDLAAVRDPVLALRKQLRVGRVPQTNALRISVSWTDPETAALLTNAVANTYQEADLEERVQEIRERVDRLTELLGQRELERRRVLEYDLRKLRSTDDMDVLLSLTSVAEDETVGRLHEEMQRLQRERESLSAQYGSGHPEMQRNRLELREATGQLRQALEAHAGWIEEELRTMAPEESEVAATFLSGQKREVAEKILEDLLEATSQQAMMAQTLESKVKIIDPAIPPLRPYAPRPLLNLALALVVGLGFGGGLLVFQEYLDVSVKTLEDVEQDLGLGVLAVVPAWDGKPSPVAREAYQTLRTSVVFASEGRRDNVLLVTASGPREGKTRTVAQLARALAETGDSVLVLDCDLRKPGLARELRVDGSRGLSSYLAAAEGEHWRGFVQRTPDGLDVLPTGPVPPNPLQLLGLERFRQLVVELKQAYDWVVVDSPPASSVSDATVLADAADAVLLVIRHDETDREVVRRAVQRLSGVGARVLGAVLNGVDMSKAYNRDYYYGRFYYGSFYGEEGAGGPKAGRSARGPAEQEAARGAAGGSA